MLPTVMDGDAAEPVHVATTQRRDAFCPVHLRAAIVFSTTKDIRSVEFLRGTRLPQLVCST